MRFASPPRPPAGEPILPMINVVFLLLIFFLMTAEIAPPDPFDVTPPEAVPETATTDASATDRELTLFVDQNGRLGFGEATGAAALDRLRAALATAPDRSVTIRADRKVSGERVAALLAKLSAAGMTTARLVVQRP